MEAYFDQQARELYEKAKRIISGFLAANRQEIKQELVIPADFYEEFFKIVDKVNASLLEDTEHFYGYFMFHMGREIRFDISSPTGVNFREANYIIYFNPILFLKLSLAQMEASVKHEILHILSMHLVRAAKLRGSYHKLAINMAMDIVVNKYLTHLPPYATTLEWVNIHYSLHLRPFESFEYYVEQLQLALNLKDEERKELEDDSNDDMERMTEYEPGRTHDIWNESDEVEVDTLREFTEKVMGNSTKGELPIYIDSMLASLKHSKEELPWNLYLNRLMGTVESNRKKTIARRSRRQPDRMELRGELRSHKAKIAVALDISASMSEEEFRQAIREVLGIVKNYSHEITILECDDELRRVYQVKAPKDIKERSDRRGGTRFSPVFEYVNRKQFNLLVYFTDGKGEEELRVSPRGYKTLWVISGKGAKLSLKNAYGVVKKLSNTERKDNVLDASDVEKGGFSMNNQEKV
jgi:predicted metal-dependent peptidase